jgi:glutathione S-transferase
MGLSASSASFDNNDAQLPIEKYDATLYYFAGRGLADQVRWFLAATGTTFTQKIINQRSQLLKMTAKGQLPFGQLPLLQIDGLDIVQSQAIVRYLARKHNLIGKSDEEMLRCDIIAETVRDLISLVSSAPFKRVTSKKILAKKQLTAQQHDEAKQGIYDLGEEELTGGRLAGEVASPSSLKLFSQKSDKPFSKPVLVVKPPSNNATNKEPAWIDPPSSFPSSDPQAVAAAVREAEKKSREVKEESLRKQFQTMKASEDPWIQHLGLMKEKWLFTGSRFDTLIKNNYRSSSSSVSSFMMKATALVATGHVPPPLPMDHSTEANSEGNLSEKPTENTEEGIIKQEQQQNQEDRPENDEIRYYLVGNSLTYVDILVAHVTTWFVEECGAEIVEDMPYLTNLQNQIISMPSIKKFIKSCHYFPLGSETYVAQVNPCCCLSLLSLYVLCLLLFCTFSALFYLLLGGKGFSEETNVKNVDDSYDLCVYCCVKCLFCFFFLIIIRLLLVGVMFLLCCIVTFTFFFSVCRIL